jgi:UDP-N-acetyl-alpha-D-muramoyl-L-alanyl-L-glutamate epimerase
MSKYQKFIFKDYSFDVGTRSLTLRYSLDDSLDFTETYKFDFEFANYDSATLDRACQTLFFMAGVSYYKTYLPPEIVIEKGELDQKMAEFFSKTYQRGLGEFFYTNRLDPRTAVTFPKTTEHIESPKTSTNKGLLVAIGGGKDSLVSVELLRGKVDDLATWSVNHRPQLTPLVQRIGLPHYWVERQWDPKLLELNKQDALNGHIPISAIFACVGSIVAILSGRRDVVMSNEQSANEPTLHYDDVAINHQYSKSQEFEQDFQAYQQHTLGETIRYYSFLRPLGEMYIAEIFAHIGFEKYKDVFSSCNQAFVHSSDHMFWDGTCPKCAFVFMALTPFVTRDKLELLFNGKNLLLDSELEATYRQLLGIEGDKPLECVGEIKESREAMHLAQKQYSELSGYRFELPEDYDYRAMNSHNMPTELFAILSDTLSAFQ